jgi:uncharacterized protein (DUF1684 family)
VADSLAIVQDDLAFREAIEDYYRTDPDSPFRGDAARAFDGLQWFPIDVRFRGTSMLHLVEHPETVTVMGTRGEPRRHLRYGYFEFPLPVEEGTVTTVRLNVYKFSPYDTLRYLRYRDELNVWFTDETTGNETYHVGRYLNIEPESPERDHLYEIDLNKAYNPYCAYNDLYSCAVPRKEDHVAVHIRAGEKTYRDETEVGQGGTD